MTLGAASESVAAKVSQYPAKLDALLQATRLPRLKNAPFYRDLMLLWQLSERRALGHGFEVD